MVSGEKRSSIHPQSNSMPAAHVVAQSATRPAIRVCPQLQGSRGFNDAGAGREQGSHGGWERQAISTFHTCEGVVYGKCRMRDGGSRMTRRPGNNTLLPTNEDTCGPFFPIYFRDESLEDLTRIDAGVVGGPEGRHIILRGQILDRHGDLANGVLLEFWQANAKGIYRTPSTEGHPDIDPWFNGYGRLRSASGEYSFRTIMPGSAQGRAPNITVTLFSDGIRRIVTQVFFADQPGNDHDPLLAVLEDAGKAKLIARHDGRTVDGEEVYLFDIIMAGDGETPFFDDLES